MTCFIQGTDRTQINLIQKSQSGFVVEPDTAEVDVFIVEFQFSKSGFEGVDPAITHSYAPLSGNTLKNILLRLSPLRLIQSASKPIGKMLMRIKDWQFRQDNDNIMRSVCVQFVLLPPQLDSCQIALWAGSRP